MLNGRTKRHVLQPTWPLTRLSGPPVVHPRSGRTSVSLDNRQSPERMSCPKRHKDHSAAVQDWSSTPRVFHSLSKAFVQSMASLFSTHKFQYNLIEPLSDIQNSNLIHCVRAPTPGLMRMPLPPSSMPSRTLWSTPRLQKQSPGQ